MPESAELLATRQSVEDVERTLRTLDAPLWMFHWVRQHSDEALAQRVERGEFDDVLRPALQKAFDEGRASTSDDAD